MGKAIGGILSNGDYNIKREPAAPAEIDEKRTAGIRLDYKLVVLQANAVGFAAALVLAGLLWIVFAFGPLVFWIVTAIVGVTTLIWWLRQEARIVWLLDEGKISGEDTTSVNVGQGIIITLFCGFVAWCFWRVLDYVNPRAWIDLTWQEIGMRVAALISLEIVTFAIVRFALLFIAFGQEMIQRSPMQEQFMWHAISDIARAWGLARVRQPRRPHPPIYHRGRQTNGDNGTGGNGRVVEVEAEYEEELTVEQAEGHELIQFLVLGQLLSDGDEPILYSRRKWNGIRLPSGRVMGVSRARAWAGLLSEMGILETRTTNTGEALSIASGYTLSSAVEQVAMCYDILPPHPREWEGWARGARVPT